MVLFAGAKRLWPREEVVLREVENTHLLIKLVRKFWKWVEFWLLSL